MKKYRDESERDPSRWIDWKERIRMHKRILVMAAVEAEAEAVKRGLGETSIFEVQTCGVGPIAAAASTARCLARAEPSYDLVISMGIGGGFAGQAPLTSIVVSDRIIAADLGAETPEGFIPLDEMGFGQTMIEADGPARSEIVARLEQHDLPVRTGPVLTVSTVTGTASSTARLLARYPDAAAEGMEGFGIAQAARDQSVPVIEIRAISNVVGPRDRDAWRIPEALQQLERVGAALKHFTVH
ncbi:futalosine hydrolase [Marinicrinis sediminis]|uniref:Futalosine hydrolase n=1 Tax=Marinicrinis sediminis TaxID=1652465 RepID=A0ABW5RF29_9BACL